MLLLLACADDPGPCDGTTYLLSAGTGTDVAIDASLSIPVYTTAENVDVLLDWSAVDLDLSCLPMDPAEDVASVGVMSWAVDETRVEDGLVHGGLEQSALRGYASFEPAGTTSVWMSDALVGPFASAYTANNGSFLLSLSRSEDFDTDVLSYAFLVPDPASNVTEVYLQPTCPQLTMDVDLSRTSTSTETTGCGGDEANSWPIDWSDLAYAMSGDALRPELVDEVVIARYDVAVEELEAQFVIRDSLAAERYTLAVEGTSADLADATTLNGDAFEGYSGSGVWVLELREEGGLPIPIWAGVVGG